MINLFAERFHNNLYFITEQQTPVHTIEGVDTYFNHDLSSIVTPIKVDIYQELLRRTHYSKSKIDELCAGFREGFDIGYRGPTQRQNQSRNIPFTIGDKFVMWENIMKEVRLGRYAGPY